MIFTILTHAVDPMAFQLRVVQQNLAKAMRERDAFSRKLEEMDGQPTQSSKDLRRAKDASSAASLRARTMQIMSRTARTPVKSATTPDSIMSASPKSPDDVAKVREGVLALLEKHDKAKVDRIDTIMEKFKGKEALLLDKMKERYESSGAAASMQRRSELALARHKDRLQRRAAKAGRV